MTVRLPADTRRRTVPRPTRPVANLSRPTPPAGADRAAHLFALHGPEVLRFARRRCPQLADDVLSETFAVAVRRADEIPHGRELPWLYVVAEHVLRNQLRSQQRAQRFQEDLRLLTPGSAPAPEVPLIGPELDELPDRERTLLVMTALEGLSAAEAADRMGIPYGSARNALMSGRRRLAERLAAAGIAVAAALLIAIIMLTPARRQEPRTVARKLDRTIAAAAAVHEVADVRTSGERHGERYERWSELDAGATTVELPSGEALSTTGSETLRAAARRDRVHLDAQQRAHLDALQVSAPGEIRALLAEPATRATVAAGPRIAGEATTTFSGERRDPSGRAFQLHVVLASDDASVLEVQARRLDEAGAPQGATTTVRFVAWEPEPRPAGEHAPTTPITSAALPKDDDPVRRPTATPADDRARVASGPASEADHHVASAVQPTMAATPAPATPEAPKILHTKVIARVGVPELARRQEPVAYNCIESWLELGGAQRFRVSHGWKDGRLDERWFTGTRSAWWGWRYDGEGIQRGSSRRTTMHPQGRDGGWLRDLYPQIEARAHDADLVAATTLDGAGARMFSTKLATGQGADVLLDPGSGRPLEVVVEPGTQQALWLTIKRWSLLPGTRERALIGHPPAE